MAEELDTTVRGLTFRTTVPPHGTFHFPQLSTGEVCSLQVLSVAAAPASMDLPAPKAARPTFLSVTSVSAPLAAAAPAEEPRPDRKRPRASAPVSAAPHSVRRWSLCAVTAAAPCVRLNTRLEVEGSTALTAEGPTALTVSGVVAVGSVTAWREYAGIFDGTDADFGGEGFDDLLSMLAGAA